MVDLDLFPKTADAFGINVKAILTAMKAERMRLEAYQMTAVCCYGGSEGLGGVKRVAVLAAVSRDDRLTTHVHIPRIACQKVLVRNSSEPDCWTEDGPITEEMDFVRAVENLTYEVIDITGHRGYERKEGAEGYFTLDVTADGRQRVRLVHQDQTILGEDWECEFEVF